MRNQSFNEVKHHIRQGRAVLGIELGSTTIKAVLLGPDHMPAASGSHSWENQFADGIWTYSLDAIWAGIQDAYKKLCQNVQKSYGEEIRSLAAIGISAMMHGYMVFDREGALLVPFRTWRNTMTEEASRRLTEYFDYPIPQRWSIAHLYQAILNREPHVPDIDYMITLEGYVHWMLTGRKVLGIGDAAGMFPVDTHSRDFDRTRIQRFDELTAGEHLPWKLADILPQVLTAGEEAGSLTEAGAALLDPSGTLESGIPLCPPEGDAGTGMAATNSVRARTGNVSAGTSIFAMVVLEQGLTRVHPEIDLVTTPAGLPVAMVHCNNCTSDLNAWVGLFREFAQIAGLSLDDNALFGLLFEKALEGDKDCGGLFACNYLSGEHITGFEEGRPLFARRPDSHFNLANFMRTNLFASVATLKTGLDILIQEEQVPLERLSGHGGLFKTKNVGLAVMTAAAGVPVSVLETAGEGGAWGIALLASYMLERENGEALEDYLDQRIFAGKHADQAEPDPEDVKGFAAFMERFSKGLPIERAAVACLTAEDGSSGS